MKKYSLFFVFILCFFCGSLSAQTDNSITIQEETTVLKKANPHHKGEDDTKSTTTAITIEKSRNPNSQKEPIPNDNDKLIISEQRSKNPKSPK